MQDTRRPPACHYDRTLGGRVTRTHRDDCPTQQPDTGHATCTGRDGCTPCTAPHCVLCTRRHLDNHHPLTCPDCIAQVRDDLHEIRWLCRHLRWQAARGGRDGRLTAAAPIPGGDAMVMLARAGADADDLIWRPDLDEDHHPDDPVPPLLPLAGWAHQWRRRHGHDDPARPSVAGVVHYLADHLTAMAQDTNGPDFAGFAHDIGALRRQLERVLHDEQEPEQGVACFECGDRLVRKFGRPRPCRHSTPAREWLAVVESYPELSPWRDEQRAAAQPCGACDQGGIIDPSVGQSWECEGCRKVYSPGEYSTAVRRDLLERGPSGDGWTHISMAAEAASTMTGLLVPAATVRKWMDRGRVAAVCRWAPGVTTGLRLVFWPDVADAAAEAVERAARAEAARRERALQAEQLEQAVAKGEKVEDAAARLRIHPSRLRSILDEWAAAETA